MGSLREAGATEAAAELCEDIAEQYPGAAWAQQQLGSLALEQGRAEEAVAALQAALRKDPANAAAWELLGAAYHMLGRFTAALKVCFLSASKYEESAWMPHSAAREATIGIGIVCGQLSTKSADSQALFSFCRHSQGLSSWMGPGYTARCRLAPFICVSGSAWRPSLPLRQPLHSRHTLRLLVRGLQAPSLWLQGAMRALAPQVCQHQADALPAYMLPVCPWPLCGALMQSVMLGFDPTVGTRGLSLLANLSH